MSTVSIDDVRQAQDKIAAVAGALDDDVSQAPSRLPGWSVGHVLAHVTLNAEAFVNVAAERRAGRLGVMYPGGMAGRSADIEALAGQPVAAISTRLGVANDAFVGAWSVEPPAGPCATAEGMPEFPSTTVLLRRLREVEVHGLDTGVEALAIQTWSDRYIAADLAVQWETVERRTDEPVTIVDDRGTTWTTTGPTTTGSPTTGSPTTNLSMTQRELLGWLLDRVAVAGLPSLAPWGDLSRWRK